MDLSDILISAEIPVRPVTPDMDRIMEIVLGMKVETGYDMAERERRWRERIEAVIDYDSLAYQAMQVGFSLHGIRNSGDFIAVRRNQARNESFISSVQAFYDGFLLAAEFIAKGGHR